MDVNMERLTLRDLAPCFEGAIPSVIATASADGVPNVTYLSKVRMVDDERVALSNQFFSKTARNLVENPQADVLIIDPRSYDQYRLHLCFERTARHGPVFDRLRIDVDVAAALEGMQDVYRLRAADIYRVTDIQRVPSGRPPVDRSTLPDVRDGLDAGRIAELSGRLGRCPDLDTVVETAVSGLAELFGYEHSLLLLLDEDGSRLYTIASHGYAAEGVGSEVALGDGLIGLAAARCTPVTVGNVTQVSKYSRTVRRSYEDSGEIAPGREVPVPGLPDSASRCAVPAMVLGELVGVLTVENRRPVAFGPADEAILTVVATILANAIESARAREREAQPSAPAGSAPTTSSPLPPGAGTHVRFFAVDGSVFLDGEYLIKGVAGRLLWALLGHHEREGRTDFTNREVRLDPSLDLPSFRDNFESRLILLKRRLDEREAPVRIDKTGRGRFRLVVSGAVRLDLVDDVP
ncbi:MAG TPA: GAF domain-containing protein [Acidimicrobiales bacterium]|nr:GAF domain-containing protein [Acidimicrobiales bacterium]